MSCMDARWFLLGEKTSSYTAPESPEESYVTGGWQALGVIFVNGIGTGTVSSYIHTEKLRKHDSSKSDRRLLLSIQCVVRSAASVMMFQEFSYSSFLLVVQGIDRIVGLTGGPGWLIYDFLTLDKRASTSRSIELNNSEKIRKRTFI
jgi:hypothetical protein